jgi:hypothetical protein
MTKHRGIIIAVAACVAIASWFLGFSLGRPWSDLAGVVFMGAIVVCLIPCFLEYERRRRRRAEGQPDDRR